jgi:hypothetical protein
MGDRLQPNTSSVWGTIIHKMPLVYHSLILLLPRATVGHIMYVLFRVVVYLY